MLEVVLHKRRRLPTLFLHLVDHAHHAPEAFLETPPPPLTPQSLPLQAATFMESLSVEVCADSVLGTLDVEGSKGSSDVGTHLARDWDCPSDAGAIGR